MASKASELPRNFPGSSSRELRGKFRLGNFRALATMRPQRESAFKIIGIIFIAPRLYYFISKIIER
jgi:hypothetical protein